MSSPIDGCLERWHGYMTEVDAGAADRESLLAELIHDDCVFYSPVVFTPQRGGEITRIYLLAAANTLGGGDDQPFRYVKEITSGHQAMLEFETSIDGKSVNGVDIITCDDDGKIIEFKVMVRPLQGVNAIHQAMMAMLESMKS